ncbi:MAG: DUF4172 domain-containing protein [Holosporales bacterium]
MRWNWQQPDWPCFSYQSDVINALEKKFIYEAGMLFGVFTHLTAEEKLEISVELISSEAIKTSEIEGEILDRDSVQSSVRKQLGLQTPHRVFAPRENGIAEMMVDLYHTHHLPLTHIHLFEWHKMLMNGRSINTIAPGPARRKNNELH